MTFTFDFENNFRIFGYENGHENYRSILMQFYRMSEPYIAIPKVIVRPVPNWLVPYVTVDDFRGISISPTIFKVFEHCILDRYADFFSNK